MGWQAVVAFRWLTRMILRHWHLSGWEAFVALWLTSMMSHCSPKYISAVLSTVEKHFGLKTKYMSAVSKKFHFSSQMYFPLSGIHRSIHDFSCAGIAACLLLQQQKQGLLDRDGPGKLELLDFRIVNELHNALLCQLHQKSPSACKSLR